MKQGPLQHVGVRVLRYNVRALENSIAQRGEMGVISLKASLTPSSFSSAPPFMEKKRVERGSFRPAFFTRTYIRRKKRAERK